MNPAFLADECLSGRLVALLRQGGADIMRSIDQQPSAPDQDVLMLANSLRRIVITHDFDFGGLVVREERPAFGIVIVRLPSEPELRAKAMDFAAASIQTSARALLGHLTNVGPNRIRRRPLANPLR
jgi:predicted nuclease of predicted toxin-antitoxin system